MTDGDDQFRTRLALSLIGFIGLTVGGTALVLRVTSDDGRLGTATKPATTAPTAAPRAPAAPGNLDTTGALIAEATKPPTVSSTGQAIAENPYADKGFFPREGYTLDVPLEKLVEPSGRTTWAPKGMTGSGAPSEALQAEFHRKGQNYGWSGGYPLPSNWDHETETEAIGVQTFDHLAPEIVSGKSPESMLTTTKPQHVPKGYLPKEGLPK